MAHGWCASAGMVDACEVPVRGTHDAQVGGTTGHPVRHTDGVMAATSAVVRVEVRAVNAAGEIGAEAARTTSVMGRAIRVRMRRG